MKELATATGHAPSTKPVTGNGGATSLFSQRLGGFQTVGVETTAPDDDGAVGRRYGEIIKRFLTIGGMAGCAMAMTCMSACMCSRSSTTGRRPS